MKEWTGKQTQDMDSNQKPLGIEGSAKACPDLTGTRFMLELQARKEELEQHKAALQHALEVLLEEYTLLFNFAPVGFMSLDCDGHILKSNFALITLLGATQSEVIRKPLQLFIAKEDRPQYDFFLKKIFSPPPGKKVCEVKILNKDGHKIIVRMEAQAVGLGQKCLLAVIDVTELRREEKKFHIMADNTYAWEFWLGPDETFIYVSPSCKRITGYKASDFLADPALFYRIIHPDDRSCFDIAKNRFPCAKVNFEYRIIHRSGSIRWIRHDGQPVIAADGTNLGVRGSNLDVTAERHLKQRLIDSVEELKKLTTELNLSEERERRRIAVALHDQVVQSLAIGNLNLDAALQKGEITDHPVLQDLKSLLERSMRDLRDLSLDLSSPILYDMGLRAAIANLGEKLGEKFSFRFVFHPECEPGVTLSEDLAVSVFQFCRELLMNAGKHSGAATVTVILHQKAEQLILNIQDDGKGFNASDCGRGFGIVNIRQRLNHLGGTFKIQSIAGTGTSAEISLNLKNIKHTR
jgi:PAS domain S-box-containing protein